MASWGYERKNGPVTWQEAFPVAKDGVRQSPIDIEDSDCEDTDQIPDLTPKYTPMESLEIENTGASWKVNTTPDKSSLTGGPLEDQYKLLQMHAHWGNRRGRGSEHTIKGKMYDGELHLVHYNTKYGAPEAAMDKPDGLAVLGVFLKVGNEEHSEFGKITSLLDKIQLKGEKASIDKIDPTLLLPDSDFYFNYQGSLTTPPLLESVIWLLYKQPITISKTQMSKMRNMKSGGDSVSWVEKDGTDDDDDTDEEEKGNAIPGCMFNNYRPVCGNSKQRPVRRIPVAKK